MKDRKAERFPAAASRVTAAFLENEGAIRRFLSRFFSRRTEIDDITQETFLRAFQAERDRDVQEPKAFLFGVARHVAINELAKKKTRAIVEFIEDSSGSTDIPSETRLDDLVDSRQRLRVFCEAIATLPAQCQRVFIMKKVYGLSHKDISNRLGISVSTVEKHVANGLLRCGAYMSKHLDGSVLYAEAERIPVRTRKD